MHLKLLQKEQFKKKAEAAGDFIGNNISDKMTKVSKSLQQNNLETLTNKHDEEIRKERYIPPEERQEVIDDLRLI